MKLITQFLQPPVTWSDLGPKVILTIQLSNTLNLCSSINARDNVLRPRKQVIYNLIYYNRYVFRQDWGKLNILNRYLSYYIKKVKVSRNRPWRPRRLWNVEALTFSRQSAHRWRWGCQPYAPAALYLQEDSWYSFLLRGWVDPRAIVRLKGLACLSSIFLPYGRKRQIFLLKRRGKIGNSASVSNYRCISILNNFSTLFEFVTHDHVSQYPQFKLYSSRHGFAKSKSTITNLITYYPLVGFQRQDDAINFDISNACYLEPHTLLLH
jgi:hypothetical protein